MRVYFEKPRTTVGWKGLINDPRLDGSFRIGEGVRLARRLLLDLVELGLPAGCEFLDPDLAAIHLGPRGVGRHRRAHDREPGAPRARVGPLDADRLQERHWRHRPDRDRRRAVPPRIPHRFLGVTEQGLAAIVITRGNDECHVILRGGARGPNYRHASIASVLEQLAGAGVAERVMVDASHGNSERDHTKQLDVIKDLAAQIAAGQRGIVGVMVESFLVAGRQDLPESGGREGLIFGKSITDACIGWDDTVGALEDLAAAVRARRAVQREDRVASTSR